MFRATSEDDPAYLGAGLFEAEPRTQFKYQAVSTGRSAWFRVVLRNAGDTQDRFQLRGDPAAPGFTVRYLDDRGNDLTASISGSGYLTRSLAPGESQSFELQVTPQNNLPLGVSYQSTLEAVSVAQRTQLDRMRAQAITCGSTPAVTISTPPDGKGTPGSVVYYPYTVTNVGSSSNRFALALADSSAALLADDGAGGGSAGDGVHQPGELRATTGTGELEPGQSYRFFVAVPIAAQSPNGSRGNTVVSATGTGASGSDQVTTTTIAPVLTVSEELRNVTQGGGFADSASALPGETIEYRMTVTNSGAADAGSVAIQATVPAFSTLVPGTLWISTSSNGDGGPCPATSCGQARESGGTIDAFLGEGASGSTGGTLPPAKTFYVYYKVFVQ